MMRGDFELEAMSVESLGDIEYDVFFQALGYESRSTYLARRQTFRAKRCVALGFNYGRAACFSDNETFLVESKFVVYDNLADGEVPAVVTREVQRARRLARKQSTLRVLIDISSFNRTRLASIVWLLYEIQGDVALQVDFCYVIGKFEQPDSVYLPNTHVGPVQAAFAGWTQSPANPTAAIVGLGYEQGQALGAIEFLQAFPVWSMFPISPISRYEAAVRRANQLLLEELPADRIVKYHVDQPIGIVSRLDALIRGLLPDYNVVLVPFGPKIFVLASLLIALRWPSVGVWRVSQGERISPKDKQGSRHIVALRACRRRQSVDDTRHLSQERERRRTRSLL